MGAEIKEIPYQRGPKAGQMAPPRLFLSRGTKTPSDTAFRLTHKTAKLVLANIGNIEKYVSFMENRGTKTVAAADSSKSDIVSEIVDLVKQL